MRQNQGHTIAELLVVMGVLLALGTIVIVATKAGIKSAKNQTSLNNLKQIHLANQLYAADHDGVIPPYVTNASLNGLALSTPEERRQNHPASKWRRALQTYKLTDDQFFAPLDPNARQPQTTISPVFTDHLITSYWHSPFILARHGNKDQTLVHLDLNSLPDPTKTNFLHESFKGYVQQPNGSQSAIPFNDQSLQAITFAGNIISQKVKRG